eukprot:gene10194-11085_t
MSTTAAGATPVSVTNEREIQPMQLSLEQLNSLKTQHENELQELARQLEALVGARNRFGISKSTLLDMGSYSDNQKLLVPLNSSLYAPGKIVDSKKVIVELGTGYFCEKEINAATELIDRKSQLIGKSIESLERISVEKRRNLERIMQVMQFKISNLQQQQQQAK